MKSCLMKTAIAGILVGILFHSASAQSFLFQSMPEDKPQFGIRFLRPNFEGEDEMSTFSGIYDFSFNIPVSSNINMVGSMPYTTVDFESDESESGIGNVYLGFQTRKSLGPGKSSVGSFGVFLPAAPEDKYSVYSFGLLTNFQDVHKYMPNTLTVYASYGYRNVETEHTMLGIEIGSVLWVPTEDKGRETELLAHYGIAGGAQVSHLAIFGELVGLAIITEDIEDFGDRFKHAVAFGAQWVGPIVRPGVFYQLYLEDDLRDAVSGVLGIKLEVSTE